jgi:DNA polymerase elongation subunit (family B)
MGVYANVRKSQGQKESYALDAIAYEELKKEKLPFFPGQTIKNLPWLNFWQFAEYNIRDVLLLHLLEEKGLDMEMLQRLSEITNTKKEKVFKKTVSLKNFVNKFAEEKGFVMSNNKNAQYGDDGGFFEAHYIPKPPLLEKEPVYVEAFQKKENYGAFVADPLKNENLGIKTVSKKPSQFIFEWVFDEDLSALYPSIIRSFNLDKQTQIGKFFLLDDEIKSRLIDEYGYDGLFSLSKNEEAEGKSAEEVVSDLGPTITDSLMSRNWSRIGEKYFMLPSTEELLIELKGKL